MYSSNFLKKTNGDGRKSGKEIPLKRFWLCCGLVKRINKTEVINDPLSQPTVPTGSDFDFDFEVFVTDGRTLCVKIVITTGHDCGRPRGSIK